MKKPLALAGLSLFVLIGAAYPDAPQLHYGAAVMAGTAEVTGPTYRPCRRDRRDDRCIQLYERGVRAAYAQWLNERGMGGPEVRTASDEPRPVHMRRHRRARMAAASAPCVTGDHRGDEVRREHREHRDQHDNRRHGDHQDHGNGGEHGNGQAHGNGEVRGM